MHTVHYAQRFCSTSTTVSVPAHCPAEGGWKMHAFRVIPRKLKLLVWYTAFPEREAS